MKKFVFMLIATFSVVVTACSAFDSDPIEPKIIGTGNLQYEAKTGTWFVVIDSTQYTITSVTIPEHSPRTIGHTQDIDPVEGMLVTVFTSHSMKGLQAITGEQSVKQIEEFYHTQRKNVGVLLEMLGIFVFGIFLSGTILAIKAEL